MFAEFLSQSDAAATSDAFSQQASFFGDIGDGDDFNLLMEKAGKSVAERAVATSQQQKNNDRKTHKVRVVVVLVALLNFN